jgi:hypothetical protein
VTLATAVLLVVAGVLMMPAPQARTVSAVPLLPAIQYAGGAPPGFSGGFGEESCHACHFHADLNSGSGRFILEGLPARFAAGAQYPITVTLFRPGMRAGGFQLTARFKDGGAQAGTLAAAAGEEERVRLESQGDVQYASQRETGTELAAPDTARWSVVWTAPAEGAVVVFHAAGNAADRDGTAENDYVHTAAVESAPQ